MGVRSERMAPHRETHAAAAVTPKVRLHRLLGSG
jgi:hypothetical protein